MAVTLSVATFTLLFAVTVFSDEFTIRPDSNSWLTESIVLSDRSEPGTVYLIDDSQAEDIVDSIEKPDKSVIQSASDLDRLLDQASGSISEMDEAEARRLYSEALEIDPENLEALWSLSLLHSKAGYRLEAEEAENYYDKAIDLAETCLDLHADDANCHYVYAVAIGRSTENAGPRTRIRASKTIKEHVDQALDLDPDHRGAWHLLGVWHHGAANLSGAERLAANVLFGGAPKGASNEAAELSLQHAIDLDPDNILFHLDLARYYRDRGWCEDAVEVIETLEQLEITDQDDPENIRRAQEVRERLDC